MSPGSTGHLLGQLAHSAVHARLNEEPGHDDAIGAVAVEAVTLAELSFRRSERQRSGAHRPAVAADRLDGFELRERDRLTDRQRPEADVGEHAVAVVEVDDVDEVVKRPPDQVLERWLMAAQRMRCRRARDVLQEVSVTRSDTTYRSNAKAERAQEPAKCAVQRKTTAAAALRDDEIEAALNIDERARTRSGASARA